MKLNPNAVVLWAVLALGFHIFGGSWVVGLFIGLCLSLLAQFI